MPPPGPKFNLLAIDCNVVRGGLGVVVVVVKEITASVTAGKVLLKGGDGVVKSIPAKDRVMAASALPATFFALQR